jgi:dCMP deaminase
MTSLPNQTDKWDLRFLRAADEVATWSKDPSTKVGCVVNPELQRRTGEGFNGFPRFMSDAPELYADRETKYSRTLHAELNAVLFASQTEGCTAYVTHPPCTNCSLILIQAGISRVVCRRPSEDLVSRWGPSLEAAKGFLAEAEVEYVEVPDDG